MDKTYDKKLSELTSSFGNWFDNKFDVPEMTNNLYPYEKIFSPIRINKLTIKNRLVMAPMGNISMAEETGRPDGRMLAYFEERAKGGVGLITTGLVPTSYGIDNSLIELGNLSYFPRIDRSRTVFSGWRDLSSSVHSHGCAIFIQLTPGLGRVGNPQCLVNSFKFPVSASWNPNFYIPQIPCRRLSDSKCTKIIKQTGQAAADARAANIDGVYLHGHEGYLLEQMTNTAFNRRKIGKYSNWQRFGLDMVKEIRRRCGNSYPIMYRIDLSLVLNETYKNRMFTEKALKKFKNERKIEQTLEYMTNLVKAGVDMFDVDLGCYDNWWLPHPPSSMPSGCFLDISEIVKKHFKEHKIVSNAGLEVPIVAVGKLGYPDLAEQAIRDEKCDMIMLGRPLLADPDWPKKAYSGNVKDIRPCIGCQEACINEFVEGGHPQCAVNPRTAFEREYSAEIPKSEAHKSVAVIGAGPAGITAASVLLERGHKVYLYEKTKKIGGMLKPGSNPKIKYEIKNYLAYLNGCIDKCKENPDFNIFMGKEVGIEELKSKNYDVVLIASGSVQSKPPVPGIDAANVYFAIDILQSPELLKDSKDIVIIGGGVVGCETAYYLKYEHSKNVKVVEMLPYFMEHTCTANRGHLIHYLEEAGVELLNCTRLSSINDSSVEVIRNISSTVPNPYNTWQPILPENVENPLAKKIVDELKSQTIKADAVILSAGARSADELFYACVKENAAAEVYNIGDSVKPSKVAEAIRSAYRKARTI